VLASIEASALAEVIRRSAWAYPLLEIVHIFSFGALIGALLTLEVRVFGVAADVAVRPLARLAVPVALAGFSLAAVSGALLWISDAVALSTHPAFLAKLGMIGMAGANAAVFHWRDGIGRQDAIARAQAALSVLLWLAVVGAGRLIAYL
jgi:hypothetical protein